MFLQNRKETSFSNDPFFIYSHQTMPQQYIYINKWDILGIIIEMRTWNQLWKHELHQPLHTQHKCPLTVRFHSCDTSGLRDVGPVTVSLLGHFSDLSWSALPRDKLWGATGPSVTLWRNSIFLPFSFFPLPLQPLLCTMTSSLYVPEMSSCIKFKCVAG